jgi:serine/threonine-protein kinase
MANSYERFGKYILLEKLASGGMAEVYLSKHTGAIGVSKFVAIKRILPQYSDNEEFIEMFKEEAKIAVNLNHSNVVHIHEFGIERNQFYLVMEYVEGRNLRQIINELKKRANHFQIDQIVYMIKEVAAGLDHAHRCLDGTTGKPLNITHRDMSPQNIMVSFEGEVKIIDFGIAKAENQLESTKAGTLKGKFGYMSPEQADGQSIDMRTDVFSLGIVLWELLAKDRLFSGSSEAAILRKIRDCTIPSLRKLDPAIHPELEKIVNKALAKDKNLRYQTSAALHRDLNRFLNTHYPEFSSQDFSVFIKHTFADSFSEQKGKLVEFSTIKLPEDPVEGKTITKVNEKYKISVNSVAEEMKHVPTPDSIVLPEENPFNIEEEKLDIPDISQKLNQTLNFKNIEEDFTGLNRTRNTKSHNTKTRNSRLAGQTKTKRDKSAYKVKKSESSFTPYFIIFLLLIMAGGGYVYLKKPAFFPEENFVVDQKSCLGQKENQKCLDKCKSGDKAICFAINKTTSPPIVKNPPVKQPKLEPDPEQDPNEISNLSSKAPPKFSIYVESSPSLAEVYVDDVKQLGYTPMKIEVPAKTEFRLKIKKDRFNEVEKKLLVTSKDFKVKEVLTELKYGYLIINSPNAGSGYEIKINDKTKPNYVLRQQIQVPAETKLTVEVMNSLGFKATQEIFVRENTRQTIEIVLKKVE